MWARGVHHVNFGPWSPRDQVALSREQWRPPRFLSAKAGHPEAQQSGKDRGKVMILFSEDVVS